MIKTPQKYKKAMKLWDQLQELDTLISSAIELLTKEIVEYEEKHYPHDKPSKEDMETFMREQKANTTLRLPDMDEFMWELLDKKKGES